MKVRLKTANMEQNTHTHIHACTNTHTRAYRRRKVTLFKKAPTQNASFIARQNLNCFRRLFRMKFIFTSLK